MCEICGQSKNKAIKNVLVNAYKYDPTGTTTIRNTFANKLNKMFDDLVKAIKEEVSDNDTFGFDEFVVSGDNQNMGMQTTTSSSKIDEFMIWISALIAQDLLRVTNLPHIGGLREERWTDVYVSNVYKRGILRAQTELKKAGITIPADGIIDSLELSLVNPYHVDRIGLLYNRVFSELRGITATMEQQISRVLSQGMLDGDNSRVIARKLAAVIKGSDEELGITDTLGRFIPAKRRAEIMARTEMTRVFHKAAIQEYRNQGIYNITVDVEFLSSKDNRVCPICKELDGNIYSLDEAENLIPVHPQCFIDAQTPVYTSKGWKKIGLVEIGDMVLTHKNRFRRVYALPKQYDQRPKVVNFLFKWVKQFTITENHLVMLSTGEWVAARDVKVGDSLKILLNGDKYEVRFGSRWLRNREVLSVPVNTLALYLGKEADEYIFGEIKVKEIRYYVPKKPVHLFNLSVEEDESYIARGIVVHNCRCVAVPYVKELEKYKT